MERIGEDASRHRRAHRAPVPRREPARRQRQRGPVARAVHCQRHPRRLRRRDALNTSTSKAGVVLSRTNYRHAYWSLAQMVAHHTSNGCNLCPGDLLGTGTQSGPTRGEEGCLLELTFGGKEPLRLPDGDSRTYLNDGDTVVMRGWCVREGHVRIGFGECRGTVAPPIQYTAVGRGHAI